MTVLVLLCRLTPLRQMLLHRSQQQPLILAVENLHWIDPTSEEWLASLVEVLPNTLLVLLTTYRPGYRPLWMDKSYATQLALGRLTSEESLAVVRSVVLTEQLPDSVCQEILSKASGKLNPEAVAQPTRHRHSTLYLRQPVSRWQPGGVSLDLRRPRR